MQKYIKTNLRSKKSIFKKKCTWLFVGDSRCKRQHCCQNGKCSYVGKRLCKIIPDKIVKAPKNKKCLFKHELAINSATVCTRRLCCLKGKCKYSTKRVCKVIPRPFCSTTFARSGNCTAKFCCRKNKWGKYNCKSRGQRTCYKKKTISVKCRWSFKKFKGLVCKKRMCCKGKKCNYTTKLICHKRNSTFCSLSFVKNGQCTKNIVARKMLKEE